MNDAILANEGHARLLADVMSGLERRPALPGGAAREKLDERLLSSLQDLRPAEQQMVRPISEPPPRPIAVAMALMLFSQPHLVATFGRPQATDGDRPVLQPLLLATEPISELLGLARWELEELQGEIDRRVSLHLKQHRALGWMWTHFGLPRAGVAALVEVLLPGLRDETRGTVGLSRRGGQLYALLDQPRAPRAASLYLAWLDRELEGAVSPRGTFAARYVDRSLLRRLCRSVGATDEEILLLLDRTVTVIPRSDSADFLDIDRWRSLAYEAVTGLAGPYPRGADLAAEIRTEDVPFEGWLRRDGEGVRVDNGKALFDSVALDRATEVARQLHAHTVACVLARAEHGSTMLALDEVVRYDVRRHLRAVLEPILSWTRNPQTAERVSRRLGVPRRSADVVLAQLDQAWQQHLATTWTGPLAPGRPASVAARLTAQLVRTRHSLGALWERPAAHEQEHREAALLFAAHYFAEAPIDRLWGRDREGLAEDPVGTWFWPTWLALLQAVDVDITHENTFML